MYYASAIRSVLPSAYRRLDRKSHFTISLSRVGLGIARLFSPRSILAVSGNRRKGDRQTIDHPCWIDVGHGRPPTQGRLCNVSVSGAKLTCEGAAELPNEFNLYLTHDGTVGRKCKVVRRTENEIGLRFLNRNVPKPNWLDLVVYPIVIE